MSLMAHFKGKIAKNKTTCYCVNKSAKFFITKVILDAKGYSVCAISSCRIGVGPRSLCWTCTTCSHQGKHNPTNDILYRRASPGWKLFLPQNSQPSEAVGSCMLPQQVSEEPWRWPEHSSGHIQRFQVKPYLSQHRSGGPMLSQIHK